MMSIFFLFSPVKFPKLRQTGSALSPGTLIANHAAANKIGTIASEEIEHRSEYAFLQSFFPHKETAEDALRIRLDRQTVCFLKICGHPFHFSGTPQQYRYYKLSDFRGAKNKKNQSPQDFTASKRGCCKIASQKIMHKNRSPRKAER